MTDFSVDTSGGLSAREEVGIVPGAEGTSPTDVSHLRPMAEGALRAAGLYGGIASDGSVRDLRALNPGATDMDPTKLPGDEDHLRKQRLEWKTKGIVERNTNADGSITLRLVHGDGDVTTGKAATDAEALDALIAKVGGTK